MSGQTFPTGPLNPVVITDVQADQTVIWDDSIAAWINSPFSAFDDPMTTQGDMIFWNQGGPDRLPIGADQALMLVDTDEPSWLPPGDDDQILAITLGNVGWIDNPGLSVDSIFGNGVGGNVTVSVNTDLIEDTFVENYTINTAIVVRSRGFRMFVRDTLTLHSSCIIHNDGANAAGQTAGGAGPVGTCGAGTAGGNGGNAGGNGSNATNVTNSQRGGGGGNGGAGNATIAGTGGTSTLVPFAIGGPGPGLLALQAVTGRSLDAARFNGGAGGGGGGGGGAAVGGGGGGGGGVLIICARRVVTTGSCVISCNGGNGAAGAGVDAGGGGSGGGGCLIIITTTPALAGVSPNVTGGAPGNSGGGGGSVGSAGADGQFAVLAV